MLRVLLVGLVVSHATGCFSAAQSFVDCNSRYSQDCRSPGENFALDAEREDEERIADDREYRSTRGEDNQYAAARPACDAGDVHACLTAAVYDERHGAPRSDVLREYAIACRAELSYGCFGVARLTEDTTVAADYYVRACHLGDKQACDVGRTVVPVERVVELDETACTLRAKGACERAAFAYGFGAGAPVDRPRALALATRGCEQQMDQAACTLRDQLR